MTRGTTPNQTFIFPMKIDGADSLYVTYTQNDKTVLEKTIDEAEISGDTVSFTLSQQDTLKFSSSHKLYVQVRFTLDGRAYATKVFTLDVNKILKEGEIGAD